MSEPEGARSSGGEPVFLGVRLDQYSGVAAALAEGLPLREILAQERIEQAAWIEADRAWKEAIVDSPDLQLRHLQLRRQAEDCLGRRVEPLDDDPAAWAGLLGALALSDDSARLLRSLGLRMSDLARLGRRWRARAAEDARVADRLAELAGKARAPTSVRCGKTELKPFPWTPAGRPEPKKEEPAEAPIDVSPPFDEPRPAPEITAGPWTEAPRMAAFTAAPTLPDRARTLDLPERPRWNPGALPFSEGPPHLAVPAGPPAARADTGTLDASSGPGAARADTGTLDASPSPRAAGGKPGPTIGGLTLAQYASLSAELGDAPERAHAILPRYGVPDEGARKKLTDAWNQVLLRDAALRAEWMQLTVELRAWLRQQKRPAGG